jgi:methyltransferase (TIGR00027 family)
MRVAVRRAAHQILDSPRVLDDPVALAIVGPQAAAELAGNAEGQQSRVGRSVRAFMVARSRFAEDALARAVERGVRQYVVLGAGLDTFAYRNPFRDIALQVFEVDHPATQEWKRRKLRDGGIPVPPSLSFAPIDFERQTLADGLAAGGFDRHAPAFFSWLGVIMYLSPEAIDATLGYVASTPQGGGLAFDYAVSRSSLGLTERLMLAALSRRVADAGEPFRTLFEWPELQQKLTAMGFRSIRHLGADEINAAYFAARADGLRVSGHLGRLVSAEI